jgi:diazepam-binding inhibitor (GABA receptor modulating acyl-CoA-binding protein)
MTKLLPPKLFYCQNPLFEAEKNNVMEMKLLFKKAVTESNSMNVRPGNETLLRLYSLYKQATKGDINNEQPGNLEEKAKFDAWASLKGKSRKDAQSEFIALVYKLKN